MLDVDFIRSETDIVKKAARDKGVAVDIDRFIEVDKKRRQLASEIDTLRQQRNQHAQSMKGNKPSEEELKQGREIKQRLSELEKSDGEWATLDQEAKQLLRRIPNIPHEEVPVGSSEDENVVIKTVGKKPEFEFDIKSHWEIAQAHDWIDKERAAKVAGARFAYLKGDLVLLEFALWQFAFSVLTNETTLKGIISQSGVEVSSRPFVPVLPPAVAKTHVYEATGRLNKEEQTYKLADDDLWLNASAEHTLAPMYLEEILNEADFPIRYVGYTTAFRREAGTYGKDMEGMFRLHQFNKLEMESFNLPEDSYNEHLFLVAIQEYLMAQLGLPYQVIEKCTADIGFPNAKGVDIEVWLPSQNQYRETHTADYITDFQARRMQTRVRREDGQLQIVHNNDATAFSERPLIAILENYQTKEGNVKVPDVLQAYVGKETIG